MNHTVTHPRGSPTEVLDAQYLAGMECCWKLFEFKFHGHEQTVISLQVHAEGNEVVLFSDEDDLEELIAERNQKSMLLGRFDLNPVYKRKPRQQQKGLFPKVISA